MNATTFFSLYLTFLVNKEFYVTNQNCSGVAKTTASFSYVLN